MLTAGVFVVICLGCLWSYWRHGTDREVTNASATNTAVFSCVAAAVYTFRTVLPLPYLADVLGGLAKGLVGTWLLRRYVIQPIIHDCRPARVLKSRIARGL